MIQNEWTLYILTANKSKMSFGLLKEPDINLLLDDEEEGVDGEDKPKVNSFFWSVEPMLLLLELPEVVSKTFFCFYYYTTAREVS